MVFNKYSHSVTPAQAGVQKSSKSLDSGLPRNNDKTLPGTF